MQLRKDVHEFAYFADGWFKMTGNILASYIVVCKRIFNTQYCVIITIISVYDFLKMNVIYWSNCFKLIKQK